MKWFNWINLVLGLWVIISPWVLGFAAYSQGMWSNVIAGVLIVVFSLWLLFGENSSNPTIHQ